jgi:hypothetical protein
VLRVAYIRYPTRSTDRYSPVAVIKGNPLPKAANVKAPFTSKLGIITVLVLLPASLGYTTTKASRPSISLFPSKLFSVFVPDVKVKLIVDRKKEFKTSCHP